MSEQQNNLKVHRLPFTQVPNDLLSSNQISGMAKALWCVFYSKPDNWTFYWREIESNFKEGREAVRNAAKQLEEMGYLKKTQKKINSGRGVVFGGMDIELFPYPNQQIQPPISNTGFPHTRSSDARQSDSTKPSTDKEIKKKDLPNKDLPLSIEFLQPIVDEIIGEREIKIKSIQEFIDWAKNEKLKGNIKNVLKAWVENPRNQIPVIKKSLTTEPTFKISALTEIKHQISRLVYVRPDEIEMKVGNLIKTQEGFELSPAEDFDVEKWREVLEKIGVKIR